MLDRVKTVLRYAKFVLIVLMLLFCARATIGAFGGPAKFVESQNYWLKPVAHMVGQENTRTQFPDTWAELYHEKDH